MSIFDLFGLEPNKVIEFLQRWYINPASGHAQRIIDVFIWFAIIYLIYRGIKLLLSWCRKLLSIGNKKRRSEYIHQNLDHDFKDYLGRKNKELYIETHFLSCPPHDYDEPNQATTASTREPMTSFCERIFKEDNPNERLYMVLAGSGMGKTTCMVNMFCHYVRTKLIRKDLSFNIRLLRLDDENVINKIHGITEDHTIDPHKTILLLDALDENRNASEDFKNFQSELEIAIQPFKLVMITCRSQFFDSEKLIPEETSWVSTGREKNLINYNKVYISPFSNEDIEKYLSIKYKGQGKKRNQAHRIVEKCNNLMVRPLLLSYIDDLLEDNVEYKELSDIYAKLIDKWLQREVNRFQDRQTREKHKETLYRFSIDIAKTIYSNWKDVKSMQLEPMQMNSFMESYGYAEVPFDIKRRSLINRNASGAFKFAHKSFLEYFLATEFFKNPSFEFDFEGMDIARTLYRGMCVREFEAQIAVGVFSIDTEKDLCINKAESVNYAHTMVALLNSHLYERLFGRYLRGRALWSVSFQWKSFSEELLRFLEGVGVVHLKIYGYKKRGAISPKKLLCIKSLETIDFDCNTWDSLPKTYIDAARKSGVATMYNGIPIVEGIDYRFYNHILSLDESRLLDMPDIYKRAK